MFGVAGCGLVVLCDKRIPPVSFCEGQRPQKVSRGWLGRDSFAGGRPLMCDDAFAMVGDHKKCRAPRLAVGRGVTLLPGDRGDVR